MEKPIQVAKVAFHEDASAVIEVYQASLIFWYRYWEVWEVMVFYHVEERIENKYDSQPFENIYACVEEAFNRVYLAWRTNTPV